MRLLRYGDGTKWGDPNTRWGSPSYVLEPGDPGYVPPIPQPNQPPKKGVRMKHNTYFPTRSAEQIVWLVNWCNKLATYATTLGLTPAQVSAGLADAQWLVYVLASWLSDTRTWALGCTTAANAAQTGDGTTLSVLPVFTPPTPPTGVVPVNTGALNRILALAQIIRDSSGYTDTIGRELGVVGSGHAGPDLMTVQPVFTLALLPTGVSLNWTWQGNSADLDMIELQVDRNDGKGYVPLAFDTTPGYLDSYPKPAALTKWKYKGIYRVGDQQVGHWSNEMSITVGG